MNKIILFSLIAIVFISDYGCRGIPTVGRNMERLNNEKRGLENFHNVEDTSAMEDFASIFKDDIDATEKLTIADRETLKPFAPEIAENLADSTEGYYKKADDDGTIEKDDNQRFSLFEQAVSSNSEPLGSLESSKDRYKYDVAENHDNVKEKEVEVNVEEDSIDPLKSEAYTFAEKSHGSTDKSEYNDKFDISSPNLMVQGPRQTVHSNYVLKKQLQAEPKWARKPETDLSAPVYSMDLDEDIEDDDEFEALNSATSFKTYNFGCILFAATLILLKLF